MKKIILVTAGIILAAAFIKVPTVLAELDVVPTISVSSASVTAGDSFTLSWSVPADIGTPTEYEFCLTNSSGGGARDCIKTEQKTYRVSTERVYYVTQTYYYKVRAKIGNEWTKYSKPVAEIKVIPIAPKLQRESRPKVAIEESYTMSWNHIPNVKQYILYEDKVLEFGSPSQRTFYTYCSDGCDREFTRRQSKEGTYYYKVQACRSGFFGGISCSDVYSNVINFEVKPNITFATSNDKPYSNELYELSWECLAFKNVDKYVLYESTNSNFSGASQETFSCADGPEYCVSDWRRNKDPGAYYYKIKAYDKDSNKIEIKELSVTIQESPVPLFTRAAWYAGESVGFTFSGNPNEIYGFEKFQICVSEEKGTCPNVVDTCEYVNCKMYKDYDGDFTQTFYEDDPIFPQDKTLYFTVRIYYDTPREQYRYSVWGDEKSHTISPQQPELSIDKKSTSGAEAYNLTWTWKLTAQPAYYKVCVSNKSIQTEADCDKDIKATSTSSLTLAQHIIGTKTFYHRVRAFDATGEASPFSNEKTLEVKGEEGLTPDNLLFFIMDSLMEQIDLALTFDPEAKTMKAMGYAEEKYAEAAAMAAQNKPPQAIERAQGAYEDYLNLGISSAGKIKDSVKKEEVITKITKSMTEQKVKLEMLEAEVPAETKKAVKEIMDINVEYIEMGLQAFPEPEKKEAVREEMKKAEQEFRKPIRVIDLGEPVLMEPVAPAEPISAPKPILAPEPAPTEPVQLKIEPAPLKELIEPILPIKIIEPLPVIKPVPVEPVSEPAVEPTPVIEPLPEPILEPEPIPTPEPVLEPTPILEPILKVSPILAPKLPDLDVPITALTFSPLSPVEGNSMSFGAMVQNLGEGPAGASTAHLKMDGAVLATAAVASLASGETKALAWNNIWVATAGAHTLEVCADAMSEVAESDETNNCMAKDFSVSAKIKIEPILIPLESPLKLFNF